MEAYVFPGQGAQFEGMGSALQEGYEQAQALFSKANEILGFNIQELMLTGSKEDLVQTRVTQPAIFLQSVMTFMAAAAAGKPSMVAGHSLGEFSALVAANVLSWEDALGLVAKRAQAMQKACEARPGTMAAILGLEDEVVEEICAAVSGVVVPANYNCPGQLVISGEVKAVEEATEKMKEHGARRALILEVGGAFHSPLMEPAQEELQEAIEALEFQTPDCPVYQNVNPVANTDPSEIAKNLIKQLTAPVKWTQTMKQMIADGVTSFIEVGGNGKVISGFVKRVDRKFPTAPLTF